MAQFTMSVGSEPSVFFRCRCYFTRNFYSAEYGKHFEFEDNGQEFIQQNSKLLEEIGCSTPEKKNKLLFVLEKESTRRKNIDAQSVQRKSKIKACYAPLHKVNVLKEEYLKEEFLAIVKHAKEGNATFASLSKKLKKEKVEGVYRLPVFKKTFCKNLAEELNNFESSNMPKGRPNTMNNGGILLDELGFNEDFITPLRECYLDPIAKILFPDWVDEKLDSHKAFTVNYKEDQDLDLGYHYDNAEVTLNVCLGKDFDDGSLYFGSMRQECNRSDKTVEVKHKVGEGVLHRGQHKHGAMPISYGERTNLIIWMRSSSIRNQLCPMCDNKPTLAPAIGFGDGFTRHDTLTVQVCSLH